ncbi:DUF2264 domain-containing protein [Vibrio vulnificus]|uniref:DUF2264 domain-containing protein n=1 Tax=Vibrio vulnificus TaxID=672 RepID=UPI001FAD1B88|nr:DUF2264 domain-containing protein [Vibrio vulnificus]MCJ0821028.1 DUF2264 domain-containing protein [Vibrio vulnificus]
MDKFEEAVIRPKIPCEHPGLKQYFTTFKENIIRFKMRRSDFILRDEKILNMFQDENELKVQCEALVSYIAEGFQHYAVWDYTHAYYPGMPSQQTARLDAMEGCSRVLPTLAAWLHVYKKEPTKLYSFTNEQLDVIDWIKRAFIAGTDPCHPGYWGNVEDYDQRICESADLALTLWLSKEHVWSHLSHMEQLQILNWFSQVNNLKTVDNNWHLFPLTVQIVIKNLTGSDDIEYYRYERLKSFLANNGWFRDGKNGNYDYYNAWGFYYSLYWIDQIDPEFDPKFIRKSLESFSDNYRYLFTSQGFPLFGRSACYRLSATVPLIAALDICDEKLSSKHLGQFKRAFKTNLSYFINNGALKKGRPTQGIFSDDSRLMDNYSGPASSFWSFRALNIALYCGDRIGLWDVREQPLEIEKGDFMFSLDGPDILVVGVQDTQEVTVIFKHEYTYDQSPYSRKLEYQSKLGKFLEYVIGRGERPKNNLLRKGVTSYSSKLFHFF